MAAEERSASAAFNTAREKLATSLKAAGWKKRGSPPASDMLAFFDFPEQD